MIHREIVSFGRPVILACDANCAKAWGHNGGRPRESFGDDPDDFAYHADHEVGEAPVDPGTYEGGDAKPTAPAHRLNRWCSRECERSTHARTLDGVRLPDFGRRLYNIPSRHLGSR